jgi:hypothetical protein
MKRLPAKLIPSFAVALFAGFALAVLTAHGCAGNCATNCPANLVHIASAVDTQLPIPNGGLAWYGPACPLDPPTCNGDGHTNTCSEIQVYGIAEGFCDVTISFSDRPGEVVRTEFGPKITQGCCVGYSIAGPRIFYIPVNPKTLIYADGGTDAVSLAPDASADGGDAGGGQDGGHDGGHDSGHDAAGDSLPPDAQ